MEKIQENEKVVVVEEGLVSVEESSFCLAYCGSFRKTVTR